MNKTEMKDATAITESESPLFHAKNTPTRIVTTMNDNTAVELLNVTDMEGLQNAMSSPKVQK